MENFIDKIYFALNKHKQYSNKEIVRNMKIENENT